jgi:1-acyl-sn-glycerol-3-phosphate acyltransferase
VAKSFEDRLRGESELNPISHHAPTSVILSDRRERLSSQATQSLPRVWRPLVTWFTVYSRRYVGKHFNSFRISRSSAPPTGGRIPIVLYANHAGWWDPLVGLLLKAAFFPNYTLFAPVEAVSLRRYKILSKVGFFGVERQTPRGVIDYFNTAEAILRAPEHLLAVTPHCRFTDARDRPVQFQRGLGLLATRVKRALFVPVAIEYAFWDQPRPEIFCRFGEAIEISADESEGLTAWHWTAAFELRLEGTQDVLAKEVCAHDSNKFVHLLAPKT